MKPTLTLTPKKKPTLVLTPKPPAQIRQVPLDTIAKTPQSKALNRMKV